MVVFLIPLFRSETARKRRSQCEYAIGCRALVYTDIVYCTVTLLVARIVSENCLFQELPDMEVPTEASSGCW
jgi:hypothetical protein